MKSTCRLCHCYHLLRRVLAEGFDLSTESATLYRERQQNVRASEFVEVA
jgi:hypothetical protein